MLLIGATGDDATGPNRGAVHAYSIEPDAVVPEIEYLDALYSCDQVTHAGFGSVLELDEGRAAVGFAGHETPDDPGGAVYLFGYVPGPFGGWSLEDVFAPEGLAPFALLGRGVALQGNALLCGAALEESEAGPTGAAYFVSLTPEEIEGGECPCSELAEWSVYGTGKPGSAGIPELSLTRELVPGELSVMRLDDVLVGGAPLLAWGLVPAAIPFDEGTFLIGDPRFVALPTVPAFGQVGIGVDVPDHPFMCGLELYFHALLIDPTADGTYSTAQSNGVAVTVGY